MSADHRVEMSPDHRLKCPVEDLIQAGNVGLVRATDRFDYRRGYRFATYAMWWIRQGITRVLSDQGRTIRIPVHMGDCIRRLYQTTQGLEQELGRRPTAEEIAEEMESLGTDEVRWMLPVSQRAISLDRPVGYEDDGGEFGDFIEDESTPPPDQTVLRHLLREKVEDMLATLPPREARVLRLRFGLNGDRGHTLSEVGDKLGVTRERVRQIVRDALRRLRHPRHRHKVREYLS